MAHNHQAPQGPGAHDPAGSTQMFRAFVDEEAPQRPGAAAPAAKPGGSRTGVIAAVIIGALAVAGAAWLAFF